MVLPQTFTGVSVAILLPFKGLIPFLFQGICPGPNKEFREFVLNSFKDFYGEPLSLKDMQIHFKSQGFTQQWHKEFLKECLMFQGFHSERMQGGPRQESLGVSRVLSGAYYCDMTKFLFCFQLPSWNSSVCRHKRFENDLCIHETTGSTRNAVDMSGQ